VGFFLAVFEAGLKIESAVVKTRLQVPNHHFRIKPVSKIGQAIALAGTVVFCQLMVLEDWVLAPNRSSFAHIIDVEL